MKQRPADISPVRFALLSLPGVIGSLALLLSVVFYDEIRGSLVLPFISLLAYATLGVGPGLHVGSLARWLGVRDRRSQPAVLVAWLFPLWVVGAAVIGVVYATPMVASFAWAIVIGSCVHVAFVIPILVAGAAANSVYLYADDPMAGVWGLADWAHPAAITVWHLVAAPGLWVVALLIPRPVPSTGRCVHCGYPTEGLPSPTCPECGRAFYSTE